MSYIGNASDIEQDKNINEFHHNHPRNSSTSNLVTKAMTTQKVSEGRWNDKRTPTAADDDSDSEISDSEHFLAKGAFLLTPSYELSMERAALICEKMNFKGCFSLTKTATGILFKFSHPEDYQSVFKKGFHKVTGARFYKKVAIPCRPQKTFTLYVLDVPEDIPVEDIRHSLYRFNSVVEVVRLVVQNPQSSEKSTDGASTPKQQITSSKDDQKGQENPPPIVRVTLASLEEFNILLQNGLNFYDATFFPTEVNMPTYASAKIAYKKRLVDGSIPGRVRELLPVFDAAGFCKLPPPASKTFKPRP